METDTPNKKPKASAKGTPKVAKPAAPKAGRGRPYPEDYAPKKAVSFRLPIDLLTKAREYAENDNREIGNLVEIALEAYIKNNTPVRLVTAQGEA